MSDHSIPILLNRNHYKVIGVLENGIATFVPEHRPTFEQLFRIFGGASVRMLEMFDEPDPQTGEIVTRIGTCEVIEFSLCPQPVKPA